MNLDVATPARERPRVAPQGESGDVVLIVDEAPDRLRSLHDALDESGYTVLVATGAEAALQRAFDSQPDIVLLDPAVPGMGGFELARRLKAQPRTAHIPIIFISGQSGTEHVVAALDAGGVDCLAKPIRPREVMARMGVHLASARRARQEARQAGQARNALDAFGYASITVRASDGRLMWQTALARELLDAYFGRGAIPVPRTFAPEPVVDWLHRHLPDAQAQIEPPRLAIESAGRRLTFSLHQQTGDSEGGGDWLIVMREECDTAVIQAMRQSFKLTGREAEVLYWVVKGKINRDVADILGSSPATVKKQLEHVFAKLGVETRTAAAAMAINRIRPLHPQFAH
jgi:DNA-binding response OmpR family regulator/DNA-binding CsgD family transcriptional regulator